MVFASPLAMWTKIDMIKYRCMMGDVPFNSVTDHLNMSGECLCGAFASEGELERLRFWYPDVAAEIDELMEEVRCVGLDRVGMLCSSCEMRSAV
jgi:hypothetical protein